MILNNKYYVLRHGEALSNVRGVTSSWPEKFDNPLTEKGRQTVKESVETLKNDVNNQNQSIDLIFSSDMMRTTQTAEIAGEVLKIKPQFDQRLREISFGVLNGRPIVDLNIDFSDETKRIKSSMEGGETYEQVLERVWEFFKETDKKYKDKNILIISHECPLWILESRVEGISILEHLKTVPRDHRIHKGQVKKLD